MKDSEGFDGFELPETNWSKLPHQLIGVLPRFSTKAELAVVLYVLRHTWGFHEYGKAKHITLDEFMHGRKRNDGSRMDDGTGLARASVCSGLQRAEENGFIVVERDDSDRARRERRYALRMEKPPD